MNDPAAEPDRDPDLQPLPGHVSPEEALAAYIDRLLAGERIDPLEVLVEHPGTGHEILAGLESFVLAGKDDPVLLRRFGDFTLLRELGRGGMGVVFEARQESMGRRVALKVLPAGAAADRKAFLRFLREAQTAGKLQHPAVVPVYSMGVESETPFYAMEYVEGATLAEVVSRRRRGMPSPARGIFATGGMDLPYYAGVARAFADVAQGLHHAHREGVVHRDIKPSNIMVDAAGRLRLLDFGLAYLEGTGTLTLSGEVVGTPLYMSPEQARREAVAVDHRTDVYSLGATLYEVLTLAPPFHGKDRHDTLRQIVERDPPSIRSRAPRTPADLETIVLKCLRKEREERYGSAQALAQDLERFILGEPIEARPEGAWERVRRHVRRNRGRLAVGLGFALLLAAAAGLAWRGERAAREAARERYRPAVLELAARLAAGEFALEASAGSQAQAFYTDWQLFTPGAREELRRLLQGAGLRSVGEAAERLGRLTDELPEERDGHYHLARAHRLLGREDLARAQARVALAIDPAFVPAADLLHELEEPARPGASSIAQGSPSWDRDGWTLLWSRARRASGSGGTPDWTAALEAYDGLLRIARSDGEPYAGLLLDAYIGRGVARLALKDLDGAILDFAVAREKAPTSPAPALFLGKAYRLAKRDESARSVFETLLRDAPADRREEMALWIAFVHESLLDLEGALAWAARIESAGPRELLRTYLYLRREDWNQAVASGRAAMACAPGDAGQRLRLVTALLGRASSRGTASCEEHLELLEEVKSLSESEPQNRHAAFLLRMALETVRPFLGTPSRSRSSDMSKPTRCLEALVGLALALGARPLAAEEQVILDDFVADPDPFDGDPLLWASLADPCCQVVVEEKPGEGIQLTRTGSAPGILLTAEVFSGDVTLRVKGRIDAPIGVQIHVNALFGIKGYQASLRRDGSAVLNRWDGGGVLAVNNQLPPGSVPFATQPADVIVELKSIGSRIEYRAWPEGAGPPDEDAEPLISMDDSTYRSGVVSLMAGNTTGDRTQNCIRWAEVTVACPCDTHCEGIDIREIQEAGNNVRVTAQASDDGGSPISYTFFVRGGITISKKIGPQSEPSADFDLPAGEYSISVSVSDDSTCSPEAADAVCSGSYTVPEGPPAGRQRPGDGNQDRQLDISDGVWILGFLFLGTAEQLPCGDGSLTAPGNLSLLDWQPDGRIDLSDGVGLLQFLFGGGGPHPLGNECTGISGCPETCEE